jgi:Fe-S-cluster-containing hydrogenase component 2
VSDRDCPLHSLTEGNWFKLICGASFQHLPAIRNLALAYSLAGADCIDVAADPAVIVAAREGIGVAATLADMAIARGLPWQGKPWLMVSLNDGEDPHFRKAQFDVTRCPTDCPRPCETICPAQAISFNERERGFVGVSEQRCYGCGRCLPVCPSQLIFARSYVSTPTAIAPLIEEMGIDAIEIHTHAGNLANFKRLWQAIAPYINRLKLLAISCPDAPDVIDYLYTLHDLISPLPCPLIWQTDGRPMSGDLGKGTTHAAIALAAKVLKAGLPGYVQLAGGTNSYTVTKLQTAGMLNLKYKQAKEHQPKIIDNVKEENHAQFVRGIAYGSYARSLLSPILEQLEIINSQNINRYSDYSKSMKQIFIQLENDSNLLWEAVNIAYSLVGHLKSIKNHDFSICL